MAHLQREARPDVEGGRAEANDVSPSSPPPALEAAVVRL